MSLANLSFRLFDNAALTIQTPGTIQFTHQSDFSDNPQNRRKWFGSPLSARKLQANSNPGVANITITPVYILPDRANLTPYTLGQSVRVGNFRYVAQTAGETAASAPTFATAIGSTVLDGSVLWRCEAAARKITDYKLALTEAGLSTATGGASLSLGVEILGGSANAPEMWMQVNNEVGTVSSNSAQPEIALAINEVIETAV